MEPLSLDESGRLLHELQVHQIELEMQNEELRLSKEELEASRERYFDLYDLAPVGYCTLSKQGLILDANLTVSTLLGVSRSALLKQPVTLFIVPEDQHIYYLHCKELFEKGKPQAFELRMVKKDGTIFGARLEATAAQDIEGTPVNRTVINDITDRMKAEEALQRAHDELEQRVAAGIEELRQANDELRAEITERIQAAESLRRAEENFRHLLDESPLGVRIVTVEGKTVYANRAIRDIFGYDSDEEMRANPIYKRYTRESYNEFKIRFNKRQQGEYIPTEYEISIVRKDGEVRYFQVFRRPVLWDGKEQFQVIYNDLTDRRRMEETIKKREEELAIETQQLAETNMALRVFLRRREEEVREMEQKILANVQKLIFPYVEELRKLSLSKSQSSYLDMIESNLRQVISPFLQSLNARFSSFTPREIRIANMIKEGKTNKEIADLIKTAPRSVKFHRNNIRKKLGLSGKKNNLRSFLLTLS